MCSEEKYFSVNSACVGEVYLRQISADKNRLNFIAEIKEFKFHIFSVKW